MKSFTDDELDYLRDCIIMCIGSAKEELEEYKGFKNQEENAKRYLDELMYLLEIFDEKTDYKFSKEI